MPHPVLPAFLRAISRVAVIGALVAVPFLAGANASTAAPASVTHAISSTTNVTAPSGNGACLNGPPDAVNCNLYSSKEDVWLSGLPNAAALGDGTYFFAVLVPGGQLDPNDGGTANLSDEPGGDTATNRTFSITNGIISYAGSHGFFDNKVQLFPYDDTSNPGGVYILAVCKGSGPVLPSDCKYDAFKVQAGATTASDLIVTKDAAGSYDTTYGWTIGKNVDNTRVEQIGGSATFNYTVTVGHGAGVNSNVHVTGTIDVFNPNAGSVSGVGVTDVLSDGTVCTVNAGAAANLTVASGDNYYAYSCDLSATPQGQLDNTATATWPEQAVSPDGALAAGNADFVFSDIGFTQTLIDNCVNVTDTYAGALGTVCVGAANPTTFNYSRVIAVPAYDCVAYDNTATFTTNTTGTTGSASAQVTVCGPAKTGALTIGFWQNKNGQGIITGGAKTGTVCNSGTWLRQYAPFQDLSSTATCAAVGTYVTNVIKAANCSGSTCNAMLKPQMLATALDVYFSNPALGGNQIKAPAPIGAVKIDLTKICRMIDGSGGAASCAGSYENTSAAFGGSAALTVQQMLTFAASQSNVGGTVWYGQVKATQVLAKDAFDAVNNQVAFRAP
ncbi:hypothetical protein [Kribbella monticola]|uniref:hypothetical protein n=1 Tax=Kribbella monticola TaxID=2185285 RepID=UPI000DD32652|nr:hypothetical protein [Kribbella monticola]